MMRSVRAKTSERSAVPKATERNFGSKNQEPMRHMLRMATGCIHAPSKSATAVAASTIEKPRTVMSLFLK